MCHTLNLVNLVPQYDIGLDIGSLTTKIVLLRDGQIIASDLTRSTSNFEASGTEIFTRLLQDQHLLANQIHCIISTGYGRHALPFVQKKVTEISAHARGVQEYFPTVQTVIDIGGQDSKVIAISPKTRKVLDFQMNDKCAAGTGRFLEVMASALDVPIEELGALALQSTAPESISSTCTVFAESEVIGLFARGALKANIAAGIHQSIARRIAGMVKRVGVNEPVAFTGGVALNPAVKKALETELHCTLIVPPHPQLTGALGAALLGFEKNRG